MNPPRRLTPGLLAALGFAATIPPFSTDAYLSSFPEISAELGVDASVVQLTLTAFLLGIGFGQLILGPVSDRRGRRIVLLVSSFIFAAASIAMVFTPTAELFIALRAVQGFFGAAGVVLSRAIAVDLSEPREAVRALSLIGSLVSIGPLIAPPIGSIFGSLFGWRAVLVFIAVIGVGIFVTVWLAIPESLPFEKRHSGGIRTIFHPMARLLRDPAYVAIGIAFMLGFGAMMAYISASPFVGQTVVGMPPVIYAIGFSTGAIGIVGANVLNSRIAVRFGPARMFAVGLGMLTTAGILFTVFTVTGTLTPASFIGTAFIGTSGTGFTIANGSALALSLAEHARGAGAALLGAGQFLLGAAVTPLVGLWGEDTALPMALCFLTCALLATGVGAIGLRRYRLRV